MIAAANVRLAELRRARIENCSVDIFL